MISVHPSGERYETVQPGIVTCHCFASGGHYDPANLRFGPLIALDEHRVEPGAGFAEHAHRGVELISWVLDGTLRHADSSGRVELIGPGTLQHQVAGTGIRHAETNASPTEPLRFVQAWLDDDSRNDPRYALAPPPLAGGQARVETVRAPARIVAPGWVFGYVYRGDIAIDGGILGEGDSVRIRGDELVVGATGEVLLFSDAGAPARVTPHAGA